MTEIEELKKSLRARLDKLGKTDVPITDTMLWHYIIDNETLKGLLVSLNDEMSRTGVARGLSEMLGLSSEKSRDLMKAIRISVFTADNYFLRGGMPENWFYNTPPVGKVETSGRIMVTGTKAEVNMMYQELEAIKKGSGKQKYIPEFLVDELLKSEVKWGTTAGRFWEIFFAEDEFLDKQVTNPKEIISTGYLRNYNMYGGETVNVKERLKEISASFGVPLRFIPSFCL